jgi:hypothetical protein
VSHDQRAERVHHHPRREKEAREHVNAADPSRNPGDGPFGFELCDYFGTGRRIHGGVAAFLFVSVSTCLSLQSRTQRGVMTDLTSFEKPAF